MIKNISAFEEDNLMSKRRNKKMMEIKKNENYNKTQENKISKVNFEYSGFLERILMKKPSKMNQIFPVVIIFLEVLVKVNTKIKNIFIGQLSKIYYKNIKNSDSTNI